MITKLEETRADQDLTQEQLARLAGVAVVTVIRAEGGTRISTLSQARLARALGQERTALFPSEEVSA